jgi:hypothetical protein
VTAAHEREHDAQVVQLTHRVKELEQQLALLIRLVEDHLDEYQDQIKVIVHMATQRHEDDAAWKRQAERRLGSLEERS